METWITIVNNIITIIAKLHNMTHNMNKYIKYSKHSAFYNSCNNCNYKVLCFRYFVYFRIL